MALLVGNAAEERMLSQILEGEDMLLKLFTNNHTPADADVEGDYTEMGATQGYGDITLDSGDWTITPGNPSLGAQAQKTFAFTAGGPTTVYGYFVVWSSDGQLAWAEKFSSPQVVENDGDQIKVTPKFTLNKAA